MKIGQAERERTDGRTGRGVELKEKRERLQDLPSPSPILKCQAFPKINNKNQ